MLTAEERGRRAIKELSPGDYLEPLGNLWLKIERRIIKELSEAEADGFKRGRRDGLEKAILAVRQYFANDEERISADALPSADECERRMRAIAD